MKHKINRTGLFILTFLLGSIVAFAQGTPDLSGTYEGMAKRSDGTTEEKVSLELKSEGGKMTGRATHGTKTVEATEVKFENGTLTFSVDKDHKFIAKVNGDKLVGEISDGTQKFPLELKKVTTATAAPAAAPGAVNLNGMWDAVADANGQPFPFALTLNIDGDKVTGNSSSQLGEAVIKSGSWKEGRLSIELDGANGTITMSAAVVDGKLSGEFDYAGQLQGKWVAVKKN